MKQQHLKHRPGTGRISLTRSIFSTATGQTASKDLYGKETDGSCRISGCQKADSNGRAAPGSAYTDTTAVPLADGGTYDCPEKVRQTGGAAGIYGMIFVQNREIFRQYWTPFRLPNSGGIQPGIYARSMVLARDTQNSPI